MNKPWLLCLLFLLYITSISAQNPGFDVSIDRYKGVPDFSIFDQSKFSVTYHNWYKIITNNVLNQSYLVTYGDQPAPQNITGTTSTTPIFVNVTNQSTIGVTGSKSAYAYLEILQLQNRVTYSDNAKLVTSPCYTDLTATNTPNIMISNTTGTNGNTTSGPITIGFSPDETMTPLNQASWIMYLGYFFDLESDAYNIYEINIKQQYNCQMKNVANAGPKTIAITSYDNNEWSLLQNNHSYYSTLISDAGMAAFNGTMANLHETDYVIDVSPPQSFAYGYSSWLQLVGTSDQNTQVFTSKKNVFRIDGLINSDGAIDWTERSPSRPDLAIQDVIHAIYPTYNTAYMSTWLRNFAKGDPPRSTKTHYPVCNNLQNMFPGGCVLDGFTPGDSNSGQGSSGGSPLSTDAKIGTIVGVLVVVVGAGAFGFYFYYRRKKQHNPDHNFYKMNDV